MSLTSCIYSLGVTRTCAIHCLDSFEIYTMLSWMVVPVLCDTSPAFIPTVSLKLCVDTIWPKFSCPLGPSTLLTASVSLTFLDSTHKRDCAVCVFMFLACLTYHSYLQACHGAAVCDSVVPSVLAKHHSTVYTCHILFSCLRCGFPAFLLWVVSSELGSPEPESFSTAKEKDTKGKDNLQNQERVCKPYICRAKDKKKNMEIKSKKTNNPICKWAENLNRHFSRHANGQQMHRKCSTSLIIGETHIKITMRCHLMLVWIIIVMKGKQ